MVTIDPDNLIFSLISALVGRVITSSEYEVSEPIPTLGLYNTEVILRPKLKGSYYAVHSLRYNRIDIGHYSPFYIDRKSFSKVTDLLPTINRVAEFTSHIVVNHLNQLVEFAVPPLRAEDVVDRQFASTDQESIYLLLNPNSYLFIGSALLSSVKPPVIVSVEVIIRPLNAPVFLNFEVAEKKTLAAIFYMLEVVEKGITPPVLTSLEVVTTMLIPVVPVVDGFSVFPPQTRIDETINLSFNLRHLNPNKTYVGYIYYKTGATAFEGDLFYKTLAITPSSQGDVNFSTALATPVEVTQTKLFLLIAESTITLPDKIAANQVYREVSRSKEIDLSANQPNVYFTSVLFGRLLKESMLVAKPVITGGSLL